MIDLTWKEIGDLVNKEFRVDGEVPRDESAYRKQYQASRLFFDEVFSKIQMDEDAGALYQLQRDELFKLKKQFFDQRREYNKLLTSEARWENLKDQLLIAADSLGEIKPLAHINQTEDINESEAVLLLSDWHYGLVANNIWNTYNVDVFIQRVSELRDKVIKYLRRHKPRILHVVVLGDMIAGAIHVSSRVDSEERTVEQLMNVSEYIAGFIASVSQYAFETKVYTAYGNHSRVIQSFQDSIHADNLERVIPWWLRQRLKDCPFVQVMDESVYEFAVFKACDNQIVAVHGDLDTGKNASVQLSQLFFKKLGINVDMIFMGHIHHITTEEDLGVEISTVGSLCGTDEYANGKRLYATPSQTLVFFTDGTKGKECRYDIGFSI